MAIFWVNLGHLVLPWFSSSVCSPVGPFGKLTDSVVVLRPTWHKIGHFGDVSQADFLAWYGKTKPNATKAQIRQSKEMYYNTTDTKKLKPDLVASYVIRPGNGEGLFWFWRFRNLSLTCLLRHLPTYRPGTHTGPLSTSGNVLTGQMPLLSPNKALQEARNPKHWLQHG